jgi:hypothetical protein
MLSLDASDLIGLVVGVIIGALVWRFFSGRRIKYLLKKNSELKDRLANAKKLYAQRVKTVGNKKLVVALHDTTAVKPEASVETYTIRGRVRVTRIKGTSRSVFPDSFVGFEEYPPEVGKPYSLFTEQGWHFRSSTVEEVGEGLVKTQNSEYQIELLDEE